MVYTPWHTTDTLQRHSLLSKCNSASWYTHKCSFIYGLPWNPQMLSRITWNLLWWIPSKPATKDSKY